MTRPLAPILPTAAPFPGSLWKRTEGSSGGEYTVILAVVGVVGAAGFGLFGTAASDAIAPGANGSGSQISSANASATAAAPAGPAPSAQAGTSTPESEVLRGSDGRVTLTDYALNPDAARAAIGTGPVTAGAGGPRFSRGEAGGGAGGGGDTSGNTAYRNTLREALQLILESNHGRALSADALPPISATTRAGWLEQLDRAGDKKYAEEAFVAAHVRYWNGHFSDQSDLALATKRAELREQIRAALAKENPTAEDTNNLEFMQFVDQVMGQEQRVREFEDNLAQQLRDAGGDADPNSKAVLDQLAAARGAKPALDPNLAALSNDQIAAERARIRARMGELGALTGQISKEQRDEYKLLVWMEAVYVNEQLARGHRVIDGPAALSAEQDRRLRNEHPLSFPLGEFVYSDDYAMREQHPVHGDRRMHWGLDMSRTAEQKAAGILPPIGAALEGEVVGASMQGGAGNVVTIQHPNGWQTRYLHLSEFSVKVGDHVTAGQQIGIMGSTGASTGPHLHFELKTDVNGSPVDPAPYFGIGPGQLGHVCGRDD